jgi:hypothetical protein
MKPLLQTLSSRLTRRRLLGFFLVVALVLVGRAWFEAYFLSARLREKTRIDWGAPQRLAETDPRCAGARQAIADASRREERRDKDGALLSSRFVAEKDIDGDGRLDRIEGRGLGLAIKTTRGLGTRMHGDYIGHSGIPSVGFDDIDGDGSLDAWFCDNGDDYTGILWGDGKGGFRGKQQFHCDRPGIPHFVRAAFRDINGDGRLDLIGAERAPLPTSSTLTLLWWCPNRPAKATANQ